MGKGWKTASKTENSQKKGQVFTKLAREIAVAAKLGGPDPEGNSRLKLAIAAAKQASCPKDTIERAIKKGSGQLDDGSVIEEVTYEGLGPHGVGIIVECQTDNKNRTVSEIRNVFSRHNGTLGTSGSCAWMFERVALIVAIKVDVNDAEEDAIEVNANSVEKNEDGSYSFFGESTEVETIRSGLLNREWEIKVAERAYLPKNVTDVTEEQYKEIEELLEALDDNDDSHRLYATLK